MSTKTLLSTIENLPPELQKEIGLYVQQLLKKSEKKTSQRGGYGSLKGMIKMKDNFDDPIPGFESYS